MSRVRSVFAVVLSGLAIPAMGQTTFPEADPLSAYLSRAELAVFTQARNAEIAASIATVTAARSAEFERALDAEFKALIARERKAEFARARNAEIRASVAAVAALRRANFERARIAEIDAALASYREDQFARQRNAEIDASITAVTTERGRKIALELQANFDAELASARETEFSRARNAEIDASIAASQEVAFARARNEEAEASIAAVNGRRVLFDTGTINSPSAISIERPIWPSPLSAFYWTLMLLSFVLMSYGLIARRRRLRMGFWGQTYNGRRHRDVQSVRRTLSRLTYQIRSVRLRFALLDGSR
jgi:hypothetical protein